MTKQAINQGSKNQKQMLWFGAILAQFSHLEIGNKTT